MKKLNLFNIGIFVLFCHLFVNLGNLVNQEFRLHKYSSMLQQDLQAVRTESKQLKQQLHFYASTQGVEELARKQLSYYRQDEIPLRVIPAGTTTPVVADPDSQH